MLANHVAVWESDTSLYYCESPDHAGQIIPAFGDEDIAKAKYSLHTGACVEDIQAQLVFPAYSREGWTSR